MCVSTCMCECVQLMCVRVCIYFVVSVNFNWNHEIRCTSNNEVVATRRESLASFPNVKNVD